MTALAVPPARAGERASSVAEVAELVESGAAGAAHVHSVAPVAPVAPAGSPAAAGAHPVGATSPRPVVLHVSEAYGGGVMNVIHDYINGAPEYDHYILCRARAEHDTGCSSAVPDSSIRAWPKGTRASLAALRDVMRELNPDIVHAHSSIAGALVRLSPVVPTGKIFYTPHCFAFERRDIGVLHRFAYRVVERALARRTAHYVAVSPRELDLAHDLRRGASGSYVPNIAVLPELPVLPRFDTVTVATVGRVSEQKAPDYFADVVRAVSAAGGPKIDWLWLGDGPERLVDPLREAGVTVSGWLPREEVLTTLSQAHVYLHTASWEGAPLSILEAAELSLPMVVRNTPATESLELDGLVDTPQQAAAAVLRACHAVDSSDIAESNRRVRERHSLAAQRAALCAAYRIAVSYTPSVRASEFDVDALSLPPWPCTHRRSRQPERHRLASVSRASVGWQLVTESQRRASVTAAHPRRPRIAMFINALARGGAETQFLRVARALAAAGYEVAIFTLLDQDDFGQDLPVHLLAPRPGPATAVNAIRRLRAWRPDAVVSFLYQATVVGRLAARAAGVPVVVSSMRNERLETRLRTVLYRTTGVLDSATVTNSVRAAQVLEAEGTVRRGRLRVIGNGVDLSLFDDVTPAPLRAELGLADSVVLFLGVGRLSPQKDWSTLVRAVAGYTGPPAHWAIAGQGGELDRLRTEIAGAGLAERITLLGLRDDVPQLLAACDALVLSSTYEGLPNVVLEAMASGRPVVATRVGGTPELVLDGFGLVVEPGAPVELAAAMTTLASFGADERRAMGAAARSHVRAHYSLQSADRQWCELLGDLLGPDRRPPAPTVVAGSPVVEAAEGRSS